MLALIGIDEASTATGTRRAATIRSVSDAGCPGIFILGALAGAAAGEDDELVAAEAADQILGIDHRAQTRGDFHNHRIAGVVPEHIVDFLEPVEIHDQQAEGLAGADETALDFAVQGLREGEAVHQPRQHVVEGHVAGAKIGAVKLDDPFVRRKAQHDGR